MTESPNINDGKIMINGTLPTTYLFTNIPKLFTSFECIILKESDYSYNKYIELRKSSNVIVDIQLNLLISRIIVSFIDDILIYDPQSPKPLNIYKYINIEYKIPSIKFPLSKIRELFEIIVILKYSLKQRRMRIRQSDIINNLMSMNKYGIIGILIQYTGASKTRKDLIEECVCKIKNIKDNPDWCVDDNIPDSYETYLIISYLNMI
jgi:hypothetical protein